MTAPGALVLGCVLMMIVPLSGHQNIINVRHVIIWMLFAPLLLATSGQMIAQLEDIRMSVGQSLFTQATYGHDTFAWQSPPARRGDAQETAPRMLRNRARRRWLEAVLLHLVDQRAAGQPEPARGARLVLILGLDLTVPGPNRSYPTFPAARGRPLRADDRAKVVLGADFAAGHGLRVGDHLRIGGRDFEVVGVLERLLTAPDRFALVSLEDGRDLWLGLDPMLRTVFAAGGALAREDLNTGAAVGWTDGVDPDALAARIRRR